MFTMKPKTLKEIEALEKEILGSVSVEELITPEVKVLIESELYNA